MNERLITSTARTLIHLPGLVVIFVFTAAAGSMALNVDVLTDTFKKYSDKKTSVRDVVGVLVTGAQKQQNDLEYKEARRLSDTSGFDKLTESDQENLLWRAIDYAEQYIKLGATNWQWESEHIRSWKYTYSGLCDEWLEWAKKHSDYIRVNNLQNRFSRVVDKKGDALLGSRFNIMSAMHYESYAGNPKPGSVLPEWFNKWGGALVGQYGEPSDAAAILSSMYARDENGKTRTNNATSRLEFAPEKVNRWQKFRDALKQQLTEPAFSDNVKLQIQLEAIENALGQSQK